MLSSRIQGSHLLLAVGRRLNTDDLRLDMAGVKADAKGFITVDDQCRNSVPDIWAMGDIPGCGAFTHTSYNDFEMSRPMSLTTSHVAYPVASLAMASSRTHPWAGWG